MKQTQLAFDFIQRLYLEISYLIKEIEGQLLEEDERFTIGRSGGYGISTRSSTGLETRNVNLWLLRKFSIFFIPESATSTKGGVSSTLMEGNKIVYMRFVLEGKGIKEPKLFTGVLHDFKRLNPRWHDRIERILGHLEYNEAKAFSDPANIDFQDTNLSFRGKLLEVNLYDLDSSEEIADKVIKPTLELFRDAE